MSWPFSETLIWSSPFDTSNPKTSTAFNPFSWPITSWPDVIARALARVEISPFGSTGVALGVTVGGRVACGWRVAVGGPGVRVGGVWNVAWLRSGVGGISSVGNGVTLGSGVLVGR